MSDLFYILQAAAADYPRSITEELIPIIQTILLGFLSLLGGLAIPWILRVERKLSAIETAVENRHEADDERRRKQESSISKLTQSVHDLEIRCAQRHGGPAPQANEAQ
jgi:hypothetical protein